ncbi:hypothetical protein OM076_11840 [Solirubrobacter ginsenosidimutans]|uniref:Uncharacterized protein n=1 Tax=Solirubrobacter ginsenosidimutans TaxID=490573 RepID=A0A9X3MR23_9ACTN|nr:hypothetical protein [Solirubrobacter ginsenosidimutans]MDA0160959.1 hypothetical protein [Solirubrobacter ginsenosidimutans]
MLTAAVVTAALFAAQAPATTINVPDSGQIVAVGAFHPKQLLGEHTFSGGVTSNRRNAIKAYGKPDGKSPAGCPNKWKKLGVRVVTADFGGGPACAGGTPVQQIVITGRSWVTERGLKIGDSLDRARELYPELERFNDLYGKTPLTRYTWALVLEESQIAGPPNVIDRLSAEIRDRKIRSFTVSPYGAGD